ncbi:MAG: T9SS type A sorting domain-containing protein [Ignavibacteria bacterium]|nr:T9SS type A sorting domain-containing protein [Ignavibacteria bacterium]
MKNYTKILLLLGTITAGVLLFQAQSYNGYNFEDDNNPLIDKPTREAFSHYHAMQDDGQQDVITDATGFDNYDAGISFAEQYGSVNPMNPLQMFFGVNGSPQDAYNTTNGGLNWSLVQPGYPGGTCCDPWSAYLSNGLLIYGSGVSGQYIYRSTNNGNTWSSPILSVSGNDRNTIGAELTGTGPFANYLYAAITGSGGAPFARSTDQGLTWTTTYTGSPHNLPGVMIAVGPNGSTNGGSVILVTSSGASYNATYTFHRSTNGGASGSFSVVSSLTVAGYSGTYNSAGRLTVNNARHRTYPMIAMDNSNGPYRGRLYLVYSSNEPAGNGNKPDIILQYSTNLGSTWSTRIRVNDDANPQNNDSWFPMIWCQPTDGKLYIKWYDDRENPASFQTGVWATYSTTGGTSFVTNQRISNASWTYPCPACGPNQNCYRGDYDAMMSNPKVGFAMWYDPRGCNYQNMGAYFPDFAMKTTPNIGIATGNNDSGFAYISIPAVKLYNDTALFSATVTNPPGSGSLQLTFLNRSTPALQNKLTTFPDSLRLRVKTVGGVPSAVYTIKVQGNGPNGTPVHVRTFTVNVGFIGITGNSNNIPEKFFLYQNYPNPFNPTTKIRFDLAKSSNVKLAIYDITGKEVSLVTNQNYEAGEYTFDFNAEGLSTGVYFYKIETAEYTSIKKMILVK